MPLLKKMVICATMKILNTIILSSLFSIFSANAANTVNGPLVPDNCKVNCVSNYVEGMKDDMAGTIDRSTKEGAAIQYLIYSPKVLEGLAMDEKKLAQEINDTVKTAAEYFKKNPQLKGSFYANFIFYPGYKKAYQIPVEKVSKEYKEQTQKLNEMLKKESTCNKEDFCGLLAFVSIDYKDAKNKNELDQIAFAKHFKANVKNDLKHFPTSKENLEPLRLILVMGTNGFHVDEEEVKAYMQKNR